MRQAFPMVLQMEELEETDMMTGPYGAAVCTRDAVRGKRFSSITRRDITDTEHGGRHTHAPPPLHTHTRAVKGKRDRKLIK